MPEGQYKRGYVMDNTGKHPVIRSPNLETALMDATFTAFIYVVAFMIGLIFVGLGLWGFYGMYESFRYLQIDATIGNILGLTLVAALYTASTVTPIWVFWLSAKK